MSKKTLDFSEFDDLLAQIDRTSEDGLKKAVDESFEAAFEIVTEKAEKAITQNKRTGRTEKSIVEKPEITWHGNEASMNVGFEIKKDGHKAEGFPSIYLMYGTPRTKKNTALYNAFYGASTRKQVKEQEAKIFNEFLRKSYNKG